MKINYFKAAEEEIASLPLLEKSLQMLKAKQQRIIAEGEPHIPTGIDYSKPYADITYINNTLNDLLELSEVTRAIATTERHITDIKLTLAELPEEYRQVLTFFYIDNLPAEKVAEKMFIEAAKTVYNLRNRAIAQYVLLEYGVYAQKI